MIKFNIINKIFNVHNIKIGLYMMMRPSTSTIYSKIEANLFSFFFFYHGFDDIYFMSTMTQVLMINQVFVVDKTIIK
jgi:hypothetical protein